MGEALLKKKTYTLQEWIELESDPFLNPEGTRYEYHHGEIYAMAGGSLSHTRISGNAYYLLAESLRNSKRNCEAFTSEIKVEVQENGRYVYPDTLAVCGEVEESKHITGSITNPTVVIEVMSDSSEGYDLNQKFAYYSGLPSVREYLVVAQDQPKVILFRRGQVGPLFGVSHHTGMETEIHLKSAELSFKIGLLYRNVTFGE